MAFDESSIDLCTHESRISGDRSQEARIVGKTNNLDFAKGLIEASTSGLAVWIPDDHLGQHRIVVDGNLVALWHAGVDANVFARLPGIRYAAIRPVEGRNSRARILGIEPRLDRMAARCHFLLAQRQSSPAATRSCHSTRSRPLIISVTGCSTWSRVFISMK